MNSNYDENLNLLISKVEGSCDLGWEELCDIIGTDVHPDSLRKAFAVTDYSGYHVAKYLMDKTAGDLTEEMINRLQSKRDEEYKERVRLQDARREYNKELRIEARYENLVDVLKENLQDINRYDTCSFGEKNLHIDRGTKKCAILMISDWHYGAICDNQWNFYNCEVAEKRAEQLIEKTKKYILSLGITDMVVEINGDMVEGLIHVGNRVSSEESAVEQIIHVTQLLSKCIGSLKPYLNSLKVVTTIGNHGRLMPNKKDQGDEKENFELLIPEMLRMILDKDIPVISSQGMDFVKYDFNGRTICLTHGHHDKVNSAINNMIRVFKEVPDEVHLGHTHHHHDINDSNIHVVVNGSIKGTDDFGLGVTRCVTKPSQNLIVYGEDRMIIEIIVD